MKQGIQVENLSKRFGATTVLDQVSIEANAGEITGIIGRNGSGKTVLFKCITGLLTEQEGKILIHREEKKPGALLSDVGVIIEEPSFLKMYSGRKNLEYLYRINNKMDLAHIEAVLEKVGLDPKSKKHVGKYSMGMKQRLAIAQVIMEDPEIIILDEPFNGLDNAGVEEMRSLFLELKKKGKIILVASHNAEDIEVLCDHVYRMDQGVIEKVR